MSHKFLGRYYFNVYWKRNLVFILPIPILKIFTIWRTFLYPFILFFTLMGSYIGQNNSTEFLILVGLGACATIMRFAIMAPLLIGFILGRMLEDTLVGPCNFDGINFIIERPMTMVRFSQLF